MPVPDTCRISTLCSAAILRTTGEDRVCRSSSAVMSARALSGAGAGAGAAAGGAAAGGCSAAIGAVMENDEGGGNGLEAGPAGGGLGQGLGGLAGLDALDGGAAGGGAGVDDGVEAGAAGADAAGRDAEESAPVPGALGGGAAAAGGGALRAGNTVVAPGVTVTAAASPSLMIATTVLMGTVDPGSTRISFSTPAAGAGISASTLSVEISKSGSSRCTRSPTFFIHLVMVPSAIDSPIWGMMTSVIFFPRHRSRGRRPPPPPA
jgi:hypothetical protein